MLSSPRGWGGVGGDLPPPALCLSVWCIRKEKLLLLLLLLMQKVVRCSIVFGHQPGNSNKYLYKTRKRTSLLWKFFIRFSFFLSLFHDSRFHYPLSKQPPSHHLVFTISLFRVLLLTLPACSLPSFTVQLFSV